MWALRAHQQNHLKDHSKLFFWGGVYFCILSSIRVPVDLSNSSARSLGGKTKTLSKITMMLILYDNCRKGKGHS